MKVKGSILGREVIVLICRGAIHNFIDEELVLDLYNAQVNMEWC